MRVLGALGRMLRAAARYYYRLARAAARSAVVTAYDTAIALIVGAVLAAVSVELALRLNDEAGLFERVRDWM